ncbi:MAG: hypothetical protein RL701_7878 [Pseudomonadota bacterium]
MHTHDPGFLTRFWLAFALFFRVLFDAGFAGRALRLRASNDSESEKRESDPHERPTVRDVTPVAPVGPEAVHVHVDVNVNGNSGEVPSALGPSQLHEAPAEAALQLLGLLQREGRLLDFLQEDMAAYTDAQVGAAARVVHDQCKRTLDAHLTLVRIRTEEEGSRVSIPKGFAPAEIRLVGNVAGEPPFTGALTHGGWRVAHIELPKLSDGHDVNVLAPAEVEL